MNIFSRITHAGKSVASKASDLTEQARLNARLSSEEAKKAKALGEIGRIYYEANKYAMGDEFLPYSTEVEMAEKEIASIKEKLRILKGVRTCRHCGARIGRHDIYCSMCGTKNDIDLFGNDMDPFDVQPDRICPVCKSEVPVGVKYCPTCGEDLEKGSVNNNTSTSYEDSLDAAEAEWAKMQEAEDAKEDPEAGFKEPADEPEDVGESFTEPVEDAGQGDEDFSDFDDRWHRSVEERWKTAGDDVEDAAKAAGEAFGEAILNAGSRAEDAWQTVVDTAEDLITKAGDRAEGAWQSFSDSASDTFRKAGDSAADFLNRASDTISDVIRNSEDRTYTEIK